MIQCAPKVQRAYLWLVSVNEIATVDVCLYVCVGYYSCNE